MDQSIYRVTLRNNPAENFDIEYGHNPIAATYVGVSLDEAKTLAYGATLLQALRDLYADPDRPISGGDLVEALGVYLDNPSLGLDLLTDMTEG